MANRLFRNVLRSSNEETELWNCLLTLVQNLPSELLADISPDAWRVIDGIGLALDRDKWSSCECGNEPSGSIKWWETVVTTQLVAPRVLLSCIELVCSIDADSFGIWGQMD
jgi:hypothetical protein